MHYSQINFLIDENYNIIRKRQQVCALGTDNLSGLKKRACKRKSKEQLHDRGLNFTSPFWT